jgi:hypothetical protein
LISGSSVIQHKRKDFGWETSSTNTTWVTENENGSSFQLAPTNAPVVDEAVLAVLG